MNKNLKKLIFIICFTSTILKSNVYAQSKHKCYANIKREATLKSNPALNNIIQKNEDFIKNWIQFNNLNRKTISIPVVIHIVYKESEENISDEQIKSQLRILNDDYHQLNADTLTKAHPFKKYTKGMDIEFKLAVQDPTGNTTTGITRTKTNTIFSEDNLDDVKVTAKGGHDNWDPTSYLNIWVCNFDPNVGLLGYATFPEDLGTNPAMDGVAIQYTAFGNIGTAGTNGYKKNAKGRTTTHEVGHWMNLFHIWGDDVCGDDQVADTEPADSNNYDCPTFPHHANNSCGSSINGEMFMNFMDYTDDGCMNMFTAGQVARMTATISGPRKDLAYSKGCTPVNKASLNNIELKNLIGVTPNPSNGAFIINLENEIVLNSEISLVDLLGNTIISFGKLNDNNTTLDCNNLPNGTYFLRVDKDNFSTNIKLIINK